MSRETRETIKSLEYGRERGIEFGKCLETGETTQSLEYGRERVTEFGKCLETGETTKSRLVQKCYNQGESE